MYAVILRSCCRTEAHNDPLSQELSSTVKPQRHHGSITKHFLNKSSSSPDSCIESRQHVYSHEQRRARWTFLGRASSTCFQLSASASSTNFSTSKKSSKIQQPGQRQTFQRHFSTLRLSLESACSQRPPSRYQSGREVMLVTGSYGLRTLYDYYKGWGMIWKGVILYTLWIRPPRVLKSVTRTVVQL
jgi:hypothetical protein